MAKAADWYFDFVSPYSYLQCERLLELPLALRARPLVFAGLLGHWGQKGPAEMDTKRRFTYEQVMFAQESVMETVLGLVRRNVHERAPFARAA